MSVKVIQGLIGQAADAAKSKNLQNNSSAASQAANVSSSAASKFISSEAVSVSVRNLRPSASSARLKEAKEATEIAEKVSEKIRTNENGEAFGAHSGLDSAKGAGHLA